MFAVGEMPVIAELALIASQRIGGQAMLKLNEASASLGGFLVGVANLVLVADPALWLFGRAVIINSFHYNLHVGMLGAGFRACARLRSVKSCAACAGNCR